MWRLSNECPTFKLHLTILSRTSLRVMVTGFSSGNSKAVEDRVEWVRQTNQCAGHALQLFQKARHTEAFTWFSYQLQANIFFSAVAHYLKCFCSG